MHFDKKPNIGLVFSGGGARGSYQVGAWKAMRELGLDKQVSIVSGASVGSINGAAFIQGDYDQMEEFWREVSFETVFKSDFERSNNYYFSLLKDFIKNKGVDVSPLKNRIREYLDEDKIRNSAIDFGIITYDLKKLNQIELYKKDIPKGLMSEYIIASSTFPLFKPHTVNDTKYLDGGISDNIPIELCLQKEGVNLIIIIDLGVLDSLFPSKILSNYQLKRSRNVIEIKPSKHLGSLMYFEKEKSIRNMERGYEDAMNVLEKKLESLVKSSVL